MTHWFDTLVGHCSLTLFATLLWTALSLHSCGVLWLDTLSRHSWGDTLTCDTLSWHFCRTLLLDTSYLTLLQDALTWPFCSTLWLDTPSWHIWFVGHSYLTRFGNLVRHSYLMTLPTWHSCRTLLLGALVRHSCKTLLLDTLVGQSYLTLPTWHSCKTLLHGTPVRHSCLKLLWGTSYLTLL